MRIYSYTMRELNDGNDPNFLHRSQKLGRLQEPQLLQCYANTMVFEIKSSEYAKNGKRYKVYVLLEDFYTIAEDEDISFEEAVKFSILHGDVHIRCGCPSFLYHGFAYQGTQLGYLYGVPREGRYPEVTNPELKSTTCKHCTKVIEWCLAHLDSITGLFRAYYDRLGSGEKLISVGSKGEEIQIGYKNGDGDVFMEIPEEEEEESAEMEKIEPTDVENWEEPFDKMENLEFEEYEEDDDDAALW